MLKKIERIKEQFWCQECKHYFLTYLRKNMSGSFTVECPSCKHHHFRAIVNGVVTETRVRQDHKDILIGLKATLSTTPILRA